MGIRGLQTFVSENSLLVKHRLQDTVMIIDGLNLEYELYSKYLQEHDDKAYGGDYTHLAVYIESFFETLKKCNVTPVVIMDGSYDSDKVKRKKERFDERMKTALAIYQGQSTRGEELNSILNSYMFVQVRFYWHINLLSYCSYFWFVHKTGHETSQHCLLQVDL